MSEIGKAIRAHYLDQFVSVELPELALFNGGEPVVVWVGPNTVEQSILIAEMESRAADDSGMCADYLSLKCRRQDGAPMFDADDVAAFREHIGLEAQIEMMARVSRVASNQEARALESSVGKSPAMQD